MAILGAGVGGMLRALMMKRWSSTTGRYVATGGAAWLSVVLASLAVSVELAIAGQISFWKVLSAMIGAHALIGIGEAIITVGCWALLPTGRKVGIEPKGRFALPLMTAVVVALLLSPLASGWPDGLEWVAAKYDFLHESAPTFVGVLPGYVLPGLSNEMLATGIAGLIGVAICFSAAWLLRQVLAVSTVKVASRDR